MFPYDPPPPTLRTIREEEEKIEEQVEVSCIHLWMCRSERYQHNNLFLLLSTQYTLVSWIFNSFNFFYGPFNIYSLCTITSSELLKFLTKICLHLCYDQILCKGRPLHLNFGGTHYILEKLKAPTPREILNVCSLMYRFIWNYFTGSVRLCCFKFRPGFFLWKWSLSHTI